MSTLNKGFTLIELMIVVAIIAILAAIALPAYQDYTIRAQVGEGPINAAALKTGVAEYYADRGVYPATNGNLGITSPVSGTYVSSISNVAGQLNIVYGNNANPKISGSILTLRAATNANGDISWVCGSRVVPPGFSAAGADASTVLDKYRASNCRL
ncbi:MAG: pilin [Xanthomonadales bacterium]|nr:pilin [Xanthomonadales bacterium]